jgi:hypothetical protein
MTIEPVAEKLGKLLKLCLRLGRVKCLVPRMRSCAH